MINYLQDMWQLASEGERQGVFFFASVYTFLVLGYSFYRQRLTLQWPATRGVLHSARLARFGGPEWQLSDQDYRTDALYEYTVAGETYQGKRVSPWVIVASHNARFILQRQLNKIDRHEDGQVTVFYDPKRPAKSFLIKPGKVGMIFTAALAIAPLLLYWLSFPV